MIAQTPTSRPAGITAARLMAGDAIEFDGIEGVVDDIRLESGRLLLTLTSGAKYSLRPCRIVTAII